MNNHDHNHNHNHNHDAVSTSVHYLARALLLAGFAFFIVYLVRTGHLDLYIAKRMQFIVKLSALGLYAVAAQQLYAAIRAWFENKADMPSCDCNHEMPSTWGKSLLLYGWFAFPLLIGFTLPDGMLGSSMAAVKGVQFAPQSIAIPSYKPNSAGPAVPTNEPVATDEAPSMIPEEKPAPEEPSSDATEETIEEPAIEATDEFMESYAKFGKKLVRQNVVKVTDKQFIETLTTIDLFRTAFVGKTIELSGFVYREESMADTQFGVSRFAINCCSADASPYGMMVNYDKANSLETDEWVTVSGKLGTTAYNGIEIIQLQVDKVVKITPPEDPYVSADLDFGLE